MKHGHLVLFGGLALSLVQADGADKRGLIDDPDGYVNVRAGQNVEAAVVATVKTGEPFTFNCDEKGEWCKVTLAAEKTGWMHWSRIRQLFTMDDLPKDEKDPNGLSEIDQVARARGFNYAATTRRAASGEPKALKQFFALAQDVDGAAAESYYGAPTAVYHILGDEKFSQFLTAQPLAYRVMVRSRIVNDDIVSPAIEYLRLHFPETAKTLFRREIVDWPSPDQRYAIRKTFSDEFDLGSSKVVRAELIEKKSGNVLCDVTRDDIGVGSDREGEVLWAPDSKRFAYLSSDLSSQPGNPFGTPAPAPQRKQTAVYQAANDLFARVELGLTTPPGRDSDAELKGAMLRHEYTTPARWKKPNVLLLDRHEYFQKLEPITIGDTQGNSIHDLERAYQITATIAPDGKAKVVWKLSKDQR
jgi:hypothetical protein